MFGRDVSSLVLEFLDDQKAHRHRVAIHTTFDTVEELEEMISVFQVSENTLDELVFSAFFYVTTDRNLALTKVLRERYRIPDFAVRDMAYDSYKRKFDEIGDYLASTLPRESFTRHELTKAIAAERNDLGVRVLMMIALADEKSLDEIKYINLITILRTSNYQIFRLLIRRGFFEKDLGHLRIVGIFNEAWLNDDVEMQKILKPLMLKYLDDIPS